MSKKRKLLITMTAALTAVALIAGVTYAWFTAQSPVTEHIYGSGSLQVASGFTDDVYWYDGTTGVMYMAPFTMDMTDPLNPVKVWNTSALTSGNFAQVRATWTAIGSFEPGDVFPYEGDPALVMSYRNVATLDAFLPLNTATFKTLDTRGIAIEPGRTSWWQFRDQPATAFRNNPYDMTGVGMVLDPGTGNPVLDPISGKPKANYISDKLLPGYAAQSAAAGGDLVLLSNDIDPASVVSWDEAGMDPAIPQNDTAIATKGHIFVNVMDSDDDTLYAILPGNVLANFTSLPIEVGISADLATNARYIDNWYSVERRIPNPTDPGWTNDFIYRNSFIEFNEGFTATQTKTAAILDILGINFADLQQAYYDDPSRIVSGTNAFTGLPLTARGDGKFHSFLYLALKYDEPIIGGTNTNLMDPNDIVSYFTPRGAGSGPASGPAWRNPQLIAKYSNIAGADAYLAKLDAARAALK